MKKIYNAPKMEIIEQAIEPFMIDTSIIQGETVTPDPETGEIDADSKGGFFEDFDDWNGWN